MKKRLMAFLLILVICGVTFCSCARTGSQISSSASGAADVGKTRTQYPLTIQAKDNQGNTYSEVFKKAPTRVVTNDQSETELLLDLGLSKYIVGTGDLDNAVLPRLEETYQSVPVLSEKGQVAKEKVLATNPDLVIGRAMSFTDTTYGSISSLNKMGVNVYVQAASLMNTTQTLENILEDIRNTGKIFDIQDKANDYADKLQARLDTIDSNMKKVSGNTLKVVLMVKYQNGSAGVFGQNASLQTEMLSMLHAENPVKKGGTISMENLVALNPDVIVYCDADMNSATDETAISSLKSNPAIQSVPAIANKRIVEVTSTELMGYGFRTFDCMETLEKAFYPQLEK
jgi:iron complex transport system substrate-binding protein